MTKERRLIAISTVEDPRTHAIVKARADVDAVVESCGYRMLRLGSSSSIGIVRVIRRHYDNFTIGLRLRATDKVFLQFPYVHNGQGKFYDNLFGSGARVDCIIHDIDSIRKSDTELHEELRQLSRCHTIIAHTLAMKRVLEERGFDGKRIRTLGLFPYITDDAMHEFAEDDASTVVFAGNMEKSGFINLLHGIASPRLRFSLYGTNFGNFRATDHVKYCGTFMPAHPGGIRGGWGLVWDGPELDTCSGLLGNYLRYNSSHKASMYLAVGLPLIVWSESSLRSLVESRGIGFAISSLSELPSVLASIPQGRINDMRAAARAMAAEVRAGSNLRLLLREL